MSSDVLDKRELNTPETGGPKSKIEVNDFNFFYGTFQALYDLTLPIYERHITALIGPSGCGKSTFLRALNRMNDTVIGARAEGEVLLNGQDIYAPNVDVTDLRQRVGMVFQRPNPFPQSIYDNVAFGPRVLGLASRDSLDQIVEQNLRAVQLWDEVKDSLKQNALSLALGQQQRLCLARTLAMKPDVLLLDEPTSSLDFMAARGIEELLAGLKGRYTLVVVSHGREFAARLADDIVILRDGRVHGPSGDIDAYFDTCPEGLDRGNSSQIVIPIQ